MKTIKTKENYKKTSNKLLSHSKNSMIKSKDTIDTHTKKEEQSANNQSIEQVQSNASKGVSKALQVTNYSIKKYRNRKDLHQTIKVNHDKNNLNKTTLSTNSKKKTTKELANKKTPSLAKVRKVNKQVYHQQMLHVVKKKKQQKQLTESSKQLAKFSKESIKKATETIIVVAKKMIDLSSTVIAFVCGLSMSSILLILIAACLLLASNTSTSKAETLPLSEDVIAYSDTIEKYAKENNIEPFIPLIKAIMMQESGGKGNDPMQASECQFNEKYEKKKDSIDDPDYSIEVGIKNLANCLKEANCNSPNEEKEMHLAMQGYNFGNGYISWAYENFQGYSTYNAIAFSEIKRKELNVTVYGDTEYVPHVLRYYQQGATALVTIAKEQLGNVGGDKYWQWYGFNSHVEWCACFVSWCANESGILNVNIPKFSNCHNEGIPWFKEHNKWQGKGYIPSSGDLIFFDWNKDGTADHVGIVETVQNNIIYTIEGNSNNECKNKNYLTDSNLIYGFGTLE